MSPLPLDQQKNPLVQSPEELERARLERESKTDTILKSRLIAEAERFIDANANDPKRVREFVEKLAVSAEGGPEALAELRRYRSSEALKMVHESREKGKVAEKTTGESVGAKEKGKEGRVTLQSEFESISKLGQTVYTELAQKEQARALEAHREYATKYGQALLLRSVALAYQDYLADIRANIRFKSLTDKPLRYAKQESAITGVIASIEATLSDSSREKLKALDLRKMVDTVFVSETALTVGRMNQPTIEYDTEKGKISLNNPFSLAETEGRYSKMKSLILEGYNKTEAPDTASLQKRKVEILSLLRKNDSRDDDPMGLNSGEAIKKQLEDDVLAHKGVRGNPDTTKVFDSLTTLKYDPSAAQEFAKLAFNVGALPDAKRLDAFFRSRGLALSEATLSSLVGVVAETIAKRASMIKLDIKQLDEALVLGLLSKEEATLYAKNKVDYDKTEYARSRFESLASATILSGLRRTIMSETLARTPGIESILKTDDTLGLYTNIEGIGGKLSDESTNNRTRWGSWVGEQLLIMYASGGIGNAVGNIPKLASVAERIGGVTAKIAIGSTARLEPWARGFGVGAGRTITEGIPFALSYSTLDGLAKEGFVNVDFTRRITEIIDQSNTKEGNTRIVLFLAVIKSISPFLRMIPSPTEWVSSIASKTLPGFSGRVAGGVKTAEAPSTLAVSADKISQALQNITLDTTTLLGADTVIRFERGEELPKRLEDIPNYVMQEVTAILPFAIGLRAMSKSMTHNPNEPIKIEIRANGDAVVKTGGETVVVPKELRQAAIAKDIAHLQKEIRGLKQSRDILRNEGDKHEAKEVSRTISGKKTEVKALKTEHAELSGNTPEGALAKGAATVPVPPSLSSREELAGSGVTTGKSRSPFEDPQFAKTSTNHSANNVGNFEYNVQRPSLADTLTGFNPTLVAQGKVSAKFQELIDKMGKLENEGLLRAQADVIVRGELKRYHDEISAKYDQLTPEAKGRVDEWRREISTQAERLSSEFVEAVRAKVQNTPMKVEWGEAKYLGEVMGRFVEGMNPRLRESMPVPDREKEIIDTIQNR